MSIQKDQKENQNKTTTVKRIAALAGVLMIILLYIGAFLAASLDLFDSGQLFARYLGALIGLPILLWLLIWSMQLLKKRREENQPPQDINRETEQDTNTET